MGLGKCSDAVWMFRNDGQNIADLNIVNAFNYGMAMWGATGTVDTETFERAVELNRSEPPKYENPNYLQCMVIAYWAAGDRDTATQYAERAQRSVSGMRGRTAVSCWRYLRVNADLFESDLGEIRALVEDGRSQMPRFVAPTATGTAKPE